MQKARKSENNGSTKSGTKFLKNSMPFCRTRKAEKVAEKWKLATMILHSEKTHQNLPFLDYFLVMY